MTHLHIMAGLLALVAGAGALAAPKGSPFHRSSGRVFAAAMVVLTLSALPAAISRGQALNIVAASLTFYLVVTSLLTVRRPANARPFDVSLMAIVMAIGIAGITFGVFWATTRVGTVFYVIFGGVALLGAYGDWRMLTRGIEGRARIARHLWRMSLAMWIATMSFFIGQARVIPEPVRKPLLLAIPVIAVGAAMFYWLWRVLAARKRLPL